MILNLPSLVTADDAKRQLAAIRFGDRQIFTDLERMILEPEDDFVVVFSDLVRKGPTFWRSDHHAALIGFSGPKSPYDRPLFSLFQLLGFDESLVIQGNAKNLRMG